MKQLASRELASPMSKACPKRCMGSSGSTRADTHWKHNDVECERSANTSEFRRIASTRSEIEFAGVKKNTYQTVRKRGSWAVHRSRPDPWVPIGVPASPCSDYVATLTNCNTMVLRPHSPVALVCGLLNVCAAFVPGNTGGMGLIPIATSAPCRLAAVSTTGSGGHPGHGRHMTVTMASSVAPAPRTKAEKTSEQFKLKDGGMVEFGSGQRVEVRVQQQERGEYIT